MAKRFTLFTLVTLLTLSGTACLAHGDLHKRIEIISQKINKHPDDLELFQQRGELYFQHGTYRSAVADFLHCSRRGLQSDRLLYFIAKSYFNLGSPRKCIRYLQAMDDSSEQNLNFVRLLGNAYFAMGKLENALACYQSVLDHAIFANADHFLDVVRVFEKQRNPKGAIGILEDGIHSLGILPCFSVKLISLYKDERMYQEALDLQNRLIANSDRKEFLLFERAKIFQLMGNQFAFENDLMMILEQIEKLPTHTQMNKSVQDILQKVRTQLAS